MQIVVTDKTIWDYPVNVQRIDKQEGVVWCNHAQSEEQEVENSIINQNGSDIVWTDRLLICRKCGAYKLDHEEYWENAPYEGAHK